MLPKRSVSADCARAASLSGRVSSLIENPSSTHTATPPAMRWIACERLILQFLEILRIFEWEAIRDFNSLGGNVCPTYCRVRHRLLQPGHSRWFTQMARLLGVLHRHAQQIDTIYSLEGTQCKQNRTECGFIGNNILD